MVRTKLLEGLNRILLRVQKGGQPTAFMLEPVDVPGWLSRKIALRPVRMSLAFRKEALYQCTYSPKYNGGGKSALTDGLRGKADNYKQFWQGFNDIDMDVVIDLGRSQTLRKVRVGFLQNHPAWIFLPKEVEISVSADGESYYLVERLKKPDECTQCTRYGTKLRGRI